MASSRNEYLTYVQLPSEGGQIGTSPDGMPIPEAPWHPIPNSRIRTTRTHPDGLLRSRQIARDLYPLYPLKTEQLASQSQPTEPPPVPEPILCRYPNIIFASFEGLFEDDGGTDQTDQLEAACRKAIAQDMPLVLDIHKIRSSRPFRLENLPPFSNLRIYSFIGTTILISPGTGADPWAVISGQEISGEVAVNFNNGGGDAPLDRFPLTQLSQSDGPGWTLTIPSTVSSLIQPGYFIKIQSKRLHNGEHRFSQYVSELNRVRSISNDGLVELDAKLRHNYRPGILHTSTVTASSATTDGHNTDDGSPYGRRFITIATSPPADLPMQGLLTTSFDGVERNIQTWDPATRTFSFPWGQRWDQFDYSPPVGSTITFSADPWVFAYAPIYCSIWGLTIDVTADYGNTQRCLQISQVDQLSVQDFKTINSAIWGLSVVDAFQPVIRFTKSERTNYGSLGYTILFSGTRDGSVDGHKSMNHRRITDSGGQCQCVGMHITNFEVTGGWKNNDGDVWEDDDEFNYGFGDHGQALDWVWENGIVRHFVTGVVLRGSGETLRNIRFEGFFQVVIQFGAGEGRTLENITVDDGLYPGEFLDSLNGIHYEAYNAPTFLAVDVNPKSYVYHGPADIRNITINGTVNQFIHWTFVPPETDLSSTVEIADWVIDGVIFRTQRNCPNAFLFKSLTSEYIPGEPPRMLLRNFTLQNIIVYYRGTGVWGEARGVAIAPNSWTRIGTHKFRFRLSDDQILELPFTIPKSGINPGNLIRISAYPTAPGPASNWFGDILIDMDSDLVVREIVPTLNLTIQHILDLGVSDPDGSLNFARDETGAVGWKMRNRLGGETYGIVEFGV